MIKTGFCFVNTSDIAGAVLARHELQGEAAWGGVLKVNFAKHTNSGGGGGRMNMNQYGGGGMGGGNRGMYGQQMPMQNFPPPPPPPPQMNMADLPSFVRRG